MLTLDEGLKLKAILGTTPDPGGEFTHAGGLMLFANAVQCFRPLNADRNNAAEPQGVAQWLDEMLDPLAQRRDLPLPEARALKTELVAALQPDLNARQNSMVRWCAGTSNKPVRWLRRPAEGLSSQPGTRPKHGQKHGRTAGPPCAAAQEL